MNNFLGQTEGAEKAVSTLSGCLAMMAFQAKIWSINDIIRDLDVS